MLSAQKGTLKTDTFDLEFSGNVVLKYQGYSIDTRQLSYRHDKKTIYTETPIKIEGETFSLYADRLSLDLNTNVTVLNGHVKGIFNET